MFFIEYFVYGIEEAKAALPKKYQDIGNLIFKENDENQNQNDNDF